MFCSVGQRPFTALFVLLHRLRPWRKVECVSLVSVLSGKNHMGKNGTLHTHTRLTALFPGLPGWVGTRKAKPNWILVKQETVSGSGISWAICKSAPRSRQITMPAPHHSIFYRPDALPAAQPVADLGRVRGVRPHPPWRPSEKFRVYQF